MTAQKKTNTDLLLASLENIHETHGPLIAEAFKQMVLPKLQLSAKMKQEMSSEEFELSLAKIKEETPAFIGWLMSQKFPQGPPPDWLRTNN